MSSQLDSNASYLTQLTGLLELGGPVVAILMAMSVVAVAIMLMKVWQFARLRITDGRPVSDAIARWQSGDRHGALEILARTPNPTARVLELTMNASAAGRIPEATIREEVTRVAADWLESLRSHRKTLEVIAALAPLLGLLGTVMGMITACQQLEAAGSRVDPALLSGGIWEALLTTAVGLAVAIPVVAVLHGLERMVERFRHRMEDAVTRVFTTTLGAAVESVRPSEDRGATFPSRPHRAAADAS